MDEDADRWRIPEGPGWRDDLESVPPTRTPEDEEASLPSDPGPKEALVTRKLRPWVEGLRRAVFDATEPPFTTEADANRWLGGGLDARRGPTKDDHEREFELEHAVEAHLEELEHVTGQEYTLQRRGVWLWAWAEEKRSYLKVRPDPETDYWRFARELLRMAEFSGMESLSLTLHVLTGQRPRLVPVQVGRRESVVPYAPEHRNIHIALRLNYPATYKGVREIHKAIRTQWPEEYDNVKPVVRLLQEVVREEIGDDPGYSEPAWTRVKERMEEEAGESKAWSTWAQRWHYHSE